MKILNLHRLRFSFLSKILLISTITTLVVAILELLLEQVLLNSYEIYEIGATLNSEDSLGSFLIPLTMALGEGALAVYIGERQRLKTVFHISSLWILVICLYLGLFVKSWLNIPPLIVDYSNEMTSIIGIVMGVFLTGERHWTRRW